MQTVAQGQTGLKSTGNHQHLDSLLMIFSCHSKKMYQPTHQPSIPKPSFITSKKEAFPSPKTILSSSFSLPKANLTHFLLTKSPLGSRSSPRTGSHLARGSTGISTGLVYLENAFLENSLLKNHRKSLICENKQTQVKHGTSYFLLFAVAKWSKPVA